MKKSVTVGAGVLLAGVAYVAFAGPLVPPAGPIDSTYRTLDEVNGRIALTQEVAPGTADAVFQITSSGTYFLTGDVIVGQNQSAIRVAAPHVTIDLNGYALVGESLFTTVSNNGVERSPGTLQGSVTVRNGVIRGFDGAAVGFTNAGDLLVVEGVTAENCTVGFLVTDYAQIRGNTVRGCATGVLTPIVGDGATGCVVEDNLIVGCVDGIRMQNDGAGHLVIKNKVFDSTGSNLIIAQGNALGLPVDVTYPDSFFGLCNAEDLSNFVR
ncbi:MAG: hypothetical protein Tsb0013_10060 [Phycisphaerales bacterium]